MLNIRQAATPRGCMRFPCILFLNLLSLLNLLSFLNLFNQFNQYNQYNQFNISNSFHVLYKPCLVLNVKSILDDMPSYIVSKAILGSFNQANEDLFGVLLGHNAALFACMLFFGQVFDAFLIGKQQTLIQS